MGGVPGKGRPVRAVRLDVDVAAAIDARVVEHNRAHPDDQLDRSEWLRRVIAERALPARSPDRRQLRGIG